MARSQESFNKKEQEKKRAQKRQEKQQRKEVRKTGEKRSFEDMIAYVDADGNISATPPDPKARREVKLEEIEVSVAKQEHREEEIVRKSGTVAFFNSSKGYGFIRDQDTRDSIFVHISELEDEVAEGDKVTFETERGPKGPNAVRVRKA